jgi:transforming growth factor-beta-induced protein
MFSRISKAVPFVLVMALLAINVVPALAAPSNQAMDDIVDIAVADGRFTTLVAAVQAADLVDTLKSEGPFTVFAPTDGAFAKLPEGTIEALLADVPALTDILLYHVVSGKAMAADVVNLSSADTVLGKPVSIRVEGDNVFVNDAQVIITDVEASNGVIHVIDTVILPPADEPATLPETGAMLQADTDIVDIAVADGRFNTLVAAVQAADLVDTLKSEGPFTVFAPTDDAFAKLPEGTVEALLEDIPTLTDILLYHVVSGKVMAADVVNLSSADTVLGKPVSIRVEGDNVFVNDAQVIITDVEASNGVIHVIDTVILPPADEPATLPETGAMLQADTDIVDIAVADGRFNTLVAAVQAADLVDTLKSEGPFTVFAPTDDAFAKLPEGTVEALLADIPTLTDILLYHVVSGKVMAADVVNLTSADTVLGKPVSIRVEGDNVFVNDAQVIITDVEASNGVIHVIDTVILPPADEPAALPETGGSAPSYLPILLALGLILVISGVAALRFSPAWITNQN